MTDRSVALCLTVLNEAESVDELFASIAGQTRPPDRIVVVDGGSTDGTVERIEGWREQGDVYAYFNNDWEGFAVENARSLKRRLRQSPAGRAPAAAAARRAFASSRSAGRSRAASGRA